MIFWRIDHSQIMALNLTPFTWLEFLQLPTHLESTRRDGREGITCLSMCIVLLHDEPKPFVQNDSSIVFVFPILSSLSFFVCWVKLDCVRIGGLHVFYAIRNFYVSCVLCTARLITFLRAFEIRNMQLVFTGNWFGRTLHT